MSEVEISELAGLPVKSVVALCDLLDRQPDARTHQALIAVTERLLDGQLLQSFPVATLAHALRQLEGCLAVAIRSDDSAIEEVKEVQRLMHDLVFGDRPPLREYWPVQTAVEHVLWLPDLEVSFACENSVQGSDWADTQDALHEESRGVH